MKKISISVVCLVIAVCLFITGVFAWFVVTGSSVNKIIVSVGSITSEVNLYRLDNFNEDDHPDIPFMYGEDLLVFDEVKTRVNIGSLAPSESATFLLRIKNTGTFASTLTFYFKNDFTSADKLSEVVSLNIQDATRANSRVLLNHSSYAVGQTIDSGYSRIMESGEELLLLLYFKFETLTELKNLSSALNPADDKFQNMTNLNEYMNTTFLLPQFTVRLEQTVV